MHRHSTVEIASVRYAEAEEPIHRIRCTVFQDEQGVAPELEFDGLDASAEHLLAYLDGQPVGTARLRAVTEETIEIERLAVLPSARGRGLGTRLSLRLDPRPRVCRAAVPAPWVCADGRSLRGSGNSPCENGKAVALGSL